jgi:hypothetical protein
MGCMGGVESSGGNELHPLFCEAGSKVLVVVAGEVAGLSLTGTSQAFVFSYQPQLSQSLPSLQSISPINPIPPVPT